MNATSSCSECERPVPDALPICETCVDRFIDNLEAVPGLVQDITITRARLDKMGADRIGGRSAETPLYVRLSGKTVTDEQLERNTYTHPWPHDSRDDQRPTDRPAHRLELQLIYWGMKLEHHYRRAIPTMAPGLRRAVLMHRGDVDLTAVPITPINTHECVAIWLAHNPELIRTFPAAAELVNTITRAIDNVRMVVDQRPEKHYVAPCPTCQNDLYAEKGAQWVKCRRCREQHETAAVKREAIRKFENTYCTMPQIAEYLELLEYEVPPRQTMHNWHYHGRLQKRGWLHTEKDGRTRITLTRKGMDPPVFRLGDVLRIMERKQAKGTA